MRLSLTIKRPRGLAVSADTTGGHVAIGRRDFDRLICAVGCTKYFYHDDDGMRHVIVYGGDGKIVYTCRYEEV